MASTIVTMTVNGEEREFLARPGASLQTVLRDQARLTGVRAGCRQGGCGSCSVLLDGELVLSCLLPAALADGHEVVTVEGLAHGDRLDPVQQAFVDHNASQCGFCTAGMVMAAKALLARKPSPSRDEVAATLAGNVCRCTGYEPIIDAVLAAAGSAGGAARAAE
jgi:aerobic carbon-monoxide dehydrogenase small subunit